MNKILITLLFISLLTLASCASKSQENVNLTPTSQETITTQEVLSEEKDMNSNDTMMKKE
jgi:uncharacterized protein YcfL